MSPRQTAWVLYFVLLRRSLIYYDFIHNSKGKNDDERLTDLLLCAKHVTKCVMFITTLNPHGPPGEDNHLSHFTAEEMEAERS